MKFTTQCKDNRIVRRNW